MKNLVFFLILFLSPVFSHAGSDAELRADVENLKRLIEAQGKNLATGLNQIQEMVGEFQKLQGQIDQAQHGDEQQSKLVSDNQRRLQVLEDKVRALSTQLEEIKTAGLLNPTQVKQLNDFREFEKALSKINAEQYQEAAKSLKAFLTANPKSIYADNAQYWVGESYFALRDFPAAVSEFQKVVKQNPKSAKIPLCLLRQGESFFEMQSFEDSKAFFTKLVTQYPDSNAANLAQGKLKEINRLLELKAKENIEKKSVM